MRFVAYDVDVSADDAIREARRGNSFLLLKHLETRASVEICELLFDIFNGSIKAPVVSPLDQRPTKEDVEEYIDRFKRNLGSKRELWIKRDQEKQGGKTDWSQAEALEYALMEGDKEDKALLDWIRSKGLSLRRLTAVAEHRAAAVFMTQVRTIREIRAPQPGRASPGVKPRRSPAKKKSGGK